MAERKSTAVLIKLSPAEKRALEAAARRENLPMATWLRALGLHAARAANEKGHTMKTILAIAILGLAACGGTQADLTEAPAAPIPAPAMIDLTGNYTLNVFAAFLDGQPHPETLMLTGSMALTQIGAKVSGLAFLRDATKPADPFAYSETRTWSGAVTVEDGVNVVRLDDPNGNHMVAVVDPTGNLTGPTSGTHATCTRAPMGWGCDAARQR